MQSLKHKLERYNKQVSKEAKRCEKYGNAMDVMFKKYREIASVSVKNISDAAS